MSPASELCSVYKLRGADFIAEAFSHPTTNRGIIQGLQMRMRAFAHMGESLTLVELEDGAFDLGSTSLNCQLFCVFLNIELSTGLRKLVEKLSAYKTNQQNTSAVFVIERRLDHRLSVSLGRPAFYEKAMVMTAQMKSGGISVLAISPSSLVARSVKIPKGIDIDDRIRDLARNASNLEGRIKGIAPNIIAFDGQRWGILAASSYETTNKANSAIAIPRTGVFTPQRMDVALRVGVINMHAEYIDKNAGLTMPSSSPAPGRGGSIDWLMRADTPPTMQTDGTLSDSVNLPSTGGASGTSQSASGWQYSGTGTCAHNYSSIDACFGCCDTLGAGATAAVSVVMSGLAAMVTGTIFGIPAAPVVLIGGIVGASLLGLGLTEMCKKECERPRRTGGRQNPI